VHLSLALREAYIIVASRDSVARWAVDGPCCRVRVDDKNRRRQRVATRSADCIVSAFRRALYSLTGAPADTITADK